MKVTKFKQELMELSQEQLEQLKDSMQRQYMSAKLNVVTGQSTNYAQVRNFKKNIARVLTIMRQKQLR